jgi:regulator of replication initiation timing
MKKFVENNPVISMVSYTILVSTAVWAISIFILSDNKESLHKTQVENLNSQIDNQKENIESLEFENERLRTENSNYLDWLRQTPNSTQFFANKIAELEKITASKSKNNSNANPEDTTTTDSLKYRIDKTIRKGRAFIDDKTGVVIGINDIHVNRTGSGTITLPGRREELLNDIKPGTKWEFTYNGINYALFIEEFNYIGDNYTITLREN